MEVIKNMINLSERPIWAGLFFLASKNSMNPISLKLLIEPGRITDLDQIMSIESVSFPYPWSEGMVLTELYDNPNSFSLIAKDPKDDRIVGYVFVRNLFRELHLLNIAVHPLWRRKGVGESLIRRVLDTVWNKGIEKVILEVRVSNRPALDLYRKFGFKQINIRPDYYCNPTENALLLQYNLGPRISPEEWAATYK